MVTTARPVRSWVSGLIACLVLLGSATGGSGTAASAAPADRPAIPAPGQSSLLRRVACPSPASCWAVGSYTTVSGALVDQILHWNGRRWSQFPAPSPGGSSQLRDVSCISPVACWAIGRFNKPGGPVLNQVLRWDGRRWSLVRTPDPGRTGAAAEDILGGVACASTASCWAVGFFAVVSVQGLVENQVLFWNGRTWFIDVVPNPAGTASGDNNALHGVRCTSRVSCWAVGSDAPSGQSERNQILHLS